MGKDEVRGKSGVRKQPSYPSPNPVPTSNLEKGTSLQVRSGYGLEVEMEKISGKDLFLCKVSAFLSFLLVVNLFL
jgi:hypothetical protein